MRKFLLLVALAACATDDTPDADPATTTDTPAALTSADIMGEWTGTTMAEGSDSVANRWTTVGLTDSTGVWIPAGTTDSIPFTIVLAADSMIATSAPYPDPQSRVSGPVRFRSIGRLTDGRLAGTVLIVLASNPDSVIQRSRWEATRAP